MCEKCITKRIKVRDIVDAATMTTEFTIYEPIKTPDDRIIWKTTQAAWSSVDHENDTIFKSPKEIIPKQYLDRYCHIAPEMYPTVNGAVLCPELLPDNSRMTLGLFLEEENYMP